MKILFVHNRYRFEGGEERAVSNLQTLLEKEGHEVQVFSRSSQEWQNHTWPQRAFDAVETVYSRRTADEFEQQVRRFQPDLAHVHNVFPVLSPSIYLRAHKLRLPVVQTVHNYRFMCANGLFLTPQNEICERCKGGHFLNAVRLGCYGGSILRTVPMALSLALHRSRKTFQNTINTYIAPSHFVKTKLQEAGFPEKRICVIPNFTAPPKISQALPDKALFLYIGRLSREKGLRTLLNAFRENPEKLLKIIGEGDLYTELKEQIETLKLTHIELLGKLSHADVHSWLTKASAVIIPSECYENMPFVMLEAWSYGLPVIASRLGGMAEAIQEDRNGFLFKAGDPDSLRQTVLLLSLDKSRSMRAGILELFLREYSPEVHYRKLMEVYERSLKDNSLRKPPCIALSRRL
jgi:glycosyltransferase involved in cell wall biosynthesis